MGGVHVREVSLGGGSTVPHVILPSPLHFAFYSGTSAIFCKILWKYSNIMPNQKWARTITKFSDHQLIAWHTRRFTQLGFHTNETATKPANCQEDCCWRLNSLFTPAPIPLLSHFDALQFVGS